MPLSSKKHPRCDQSVGDGMSQNRVSDSAPSKLGERKNSSRDRSGEPTFAMEDSERYRRNQKGSPRKEPPTDRFKVGRLKAAQQKSAEREFFGDRHHHYGSNDAHRHPGDSRGARCVRERGGGGGMKGLLKCHPDCENQNARSRANPPEAPIQIAIAAAKVKESAAGRDYAQGIEPFKVDGESARNHGYSQDRQEGHQVGNGRIRVHFLTVAARCKGNQAQGRDAARQNTD